MSAIEKWAADEFRSVNGQILYLLNEALKKIDGCRKKSNIFCEIKKTYYLCSVKS
jgi:hypothetical protein